MKRNWIRMSVAAALGALAGWLYWKYFGCTNGCSITGSPVNSTLYGAVMGVLVQGSFRPRRMGSKGSAEGGQG